MQGDCETYAIGSHIPGGFIGVASFKRLAEVAEKFGPAAMKLTSGQGIAIVGLKDADLGAAWPGSGYANRLRHRPVRPHGEVLPGHHLLPPRQKGRHGG